MEALLLAYTLSGAAGIRSSWVMLIVAVSAHFGRLHPPASLEWVGSWWLIVLALCASILDFFGDKIPALDHALHAVHLALAPIAGGLAAASGYHGDPVVEVILAAIGGGNAFVVHSARTGLRAVSSATTLGIANPLISILEDVAAGALILAAFLIPVLTSLLLVLATIWITKKVYRLVKVVG